jgi:Winged helix DNA-binding domain
MDVAEWVARLRMRALGLWGRRLRGPSDVVRHLLAMQSQEHPYARWSVAQRASGMVNAAGFDRAFDDGRILRTHALRPTWHYVAPEDLRWLLALSGPRVDSGNRRRYAELGLDARTLARADDVIAAAVADRPRTRPELGEALERQRISAADQRIAYLVMHAELRAVICSGPMRGKQHTYAAFDERVPRGATVEGDDALAELARRFFATRGPATLRDFVWWSGLATAEARGALELVRPEFASRVVDGRTYWFVERRVPKAQPVVDLVQCYDEVIISYRESRDVLQTGGSNFPVPRHLDGFVHVVLLDGRLLGHWRARRDRGGISIETRVERELDRQEQTALAAAVDRYRRFAEPTAA